jgi:hypothetical protein
MKLIGNGREMCFALIERGPKASRQAAAARSEEGAMTLGLILIILLLIILLGGYSGRLGGYGYGLGHSGMGLFGVILIVVAILTWLDKL